jgi:hypothetical protein
MNKEERKAELVQENEWLPKAIETLNLRLIDKGFNVFMEFMGYHDEYVLCFNQRRFYSHEDDCYKTSDWGKLEVHSKTKVFNPYKFVGGDGYEYEKLSEMEIHKDMWKPIKRWISLNDHIVNGKKIDLYSDPYYKRTEFIGGSDVPLSGRYE